MRRLPRVLGLAAAALAALASGCGPADDALVVTGPAGRVVVTRSPFSLRVEDTAGNTALALAAGEARPRRHPVRAPGGDGRRRARQLAYPVLTGAPDTNPADPTPPTRFPAKDVIEAHQDGGALVATISTSDPGHTITLRVQAEGAGAFDVQATSTGASALAASFASGADEGFHGMGGRRESTDLRGRHILGWVLDYRYPNVTGSYYYVEPLVLSSRGYGLWLDQTENASFRLASDVDDAWRVAVVGPALDSRRLSRPLGRSASGALTAITGRHRLPPAWSTGPTISRAVQVGETITAYEEDIAADLDRIQADALPVTAYCFEGWALLPDAFVASTMATLTARGLHGVLYIRLFVEKDSGGTQLPSWYDEALANGYVAKTQGGQPYVLPGVFLTDMAVLDFTNPATLAFWSAQVALMLDTGADGFMDDFGEQVLSDMVFADGSTGVTMHNRYPVLQHQATRAAVDAYVKLHPGRDIYFFTRSGHTGRPGGAAYENATFPGDELPNSTPRRGSPRSSPTCSTAPWAGPGASPPTSPGTRTSSAPPPPSSTPWSEAAALMPFFRVHNGPLDGPRMPWSYDAATEATWTAMATLHQAKAPVFVAAWNEAVQTGMPVVRPLARRPGLGGDAARRRRAAGWRRSARRAGGRGGRDLARGVAPGRLLAGARRGPSPPAGRPSR